MGTPATKWPNQEETMAKAKTATTENSVTLVVQPPKKTSAVFGIVGTAPYVQLRFSQKAKNKIAETHEAGQRSKKGSKREARDFEADFHRAYYRDVKGRYGIPATAFRNALIAACRSVGFTMTRAKQAVFVEADCYDAEDGTPLVLISGEPRAVRHAVRNANGGSDLRMRAMWDPGWQASPTLSFDGDAFSLADVANLLAHAGMWVGVGEGRAASRNSAGMGWGHFSIQEG